MSDTQPRRRGRALRIVVIVLALIVLVPVAGIAVFALTFDPDSVKPRIEQAVKQATGRDLVLNGRLGLKWSLWPTIEARDAALANVAGGSRPQMMTLQSLEAQVALIPLLRRTVEIDRLVLVHPDILLETDAQGRPNWRFGPDVPSERLPKAETPAKAAAPLDISVRQVRIDGGLLTWRDGRTGQGVTLTLTGLQAEAATTESPVRFALQAVYAGTPLTVTGETGPLARLRDPAATAPWPVRAVLEAAGARLTVDGTMTQPMQGRGYQAKLDAAIPDLAALAPLLHRAALPALRDVHAAASVADGGNGVPATSAITARAGASDLSVFLPGLSVAALDVQSAHLGDPVRIAANGAFRQLPWTTSLAVLTDAAGGATARDLKIGTPHGNLTGDLAFGWAGRPSLRGTIASQRIDYDGLMAAIAPPAASTSSPPPPAAAAPPTSEAVKNDRRVFGDRPIPFALLRAADADIRVSIAALHAGGQDVQDIAGHVVLADGALTVDPVGAKLPAGRLDGRMTADARQPNPPVALVLRGPGLQLAPLLALFGLPPEARGAIDVDADLHGAGNTPHALAASADGHLGLAMVNGEVDNRLISGTLGQVLQRARLPDVTARPGSTPIRCLALRLDSRQGIADVRALLLDTSLFYLEGSGSLNLGDETMALRLRPLARLGGTGVIVPLRVQGGFRAPKVEVDAAGAVGEAAGLAARSDRLPPQLGVIIGALGGNGMVQGGGADDCARQLAIARGGLPGPTPAAAPAAATAAPQEKQKLPKPADLLRQFLR